MDRLDKVIVVNKPWGSEIIYAHTDNYVGKILNIKAGHALSYQYHNLKEETIYLLSGSIEVVTENGAVKIAPGQRFHVNPLFKHRFKAIEDSVVLEASTPHLDDLVRLQDDYGR